jgi:hypothetical protein
MLDMFVPLFKVLQEQRELFVYAILLAYGLSQRHEVRALQDRNTKLQDKMLDQTAETNDLLGQFKVLLEVLTRGRR